MVLVSPILGLREVGKGKNLSCLPTGCPFRAGDAVKASTIGELTVFEKALRTTVIRPFDANQVVVKIDGRERCYPTSWFALNIKPRSKPNRRH